jgi:hypothetical protein
MHYFDGGNWLFPMTNEVYINKTTNEKSLSTNGIPCCAIKQQNLKHLSKG